MASFSRRDLLLVALFFTLSIGTLGKECFIERIINLGDSLSDTGNRVREPGAFTLVNQKFPPYGESIPEGPTGRCSDGLLIIDHIAKGLGLPRLPAYLDESAKFDHGVNFAVAGATALNPKRLEALGIHLSYTRSSLEVQLSWFNNYLLVACPSYPDCSEHLEKTLFLVGEIGGNDYNFALTQNKPTNQVMLLVPMVVDMIMNTAQSIIDNGAKNLVIPGNFPIGCFPIHLTFFENTRALDNFGCISELNDFSKFHNEYLQFSIRDLRRKNPNVSIEYADYYYSTLKMIRNPSAYGFQEGSQFQACCGIGGAYNYNRTLGCTKGVPVCSDPSKSISWDGVHLTQAAYAVIANQLFSNVELLNQWKCTDA